MYNNGCWWVFDPHWMTHLCGTYIIMDAGGCLIHIGWRIFVVHV